MRKTTKQQISRLSVEGVEMELIRRPVKRLRISVYPPDGRVRVVAPFPLSDAFLQATITDKLPWIKEKQVQLTQTVAITPAAYTTGETHYFLGHPYQLQVVSHKGPPKVSICNEKTIAIFARESSADTQREKVFLAWYREQLRILIPVLLDKWQPTIGVAVNDWGVKRMKTRWGTCNVTAKRIWLNLELAKEPFDCLEYVVVHELVHLLERSHNARFWAFMSTFLPDWRERKNLLNKKVF